jgi:peptidoglycan/xylan/chitin deacetylase (PgdA/CDA1 family)
VPPVAITIDTEFPDQPAEDPLGTLNELLEVLAGRSVRATFFIAGAWAQANAKHVLAIKDAGHQIGNHSYSHCALSRMTAAGIVEDLTACGEVLAGMGIESQPWFRAPYGELGHPELDVREAIRRAGYRHIHWHAHGEDWGPGASADSVASAILGEVHRRWPRPAIVLLHSWPDAAPGALQLLLEHLEAGGATFSTVDQLGWRQAVAGRLRETTLRRPDR